MPKEKEKQKHIWHIAWVGHAMSPNLDGHSYAVVEWVCDRALCNATQYELVRLQFVCMNTQTMRLEHCKGDNRLEKDSCHCNCHTRKANPLPDCLGGNAEHSFLADAD